MDLQKYLSLIIHDNGTNAYSVCGICRDSTSGGLRNPMNKHQVIWLSMMIMKSLLPPV